MSNKEEILKKWVGQPSSSFLIQYLRDAEKRTAWQFLEEKKVILDIASESNVTFGIKAKEIKRIDFSSRASQLAQELLAGRVNKFVVLDSSNPQFPFSKNSFDGAVSIGPYDWLFLDIDKLTEQVYKVLDKKGFFVFSLPMIKSAYCTSKSRTRFRYYRVEELSSLINNQNWRLKDFRLIYQPPKVFYSIFSLLPVVLQKLIIRRSWKKTDLYTHNKLWHKASYIVLALEKK